MIRLASRPRIFRFAALSSFVLSFLLAVPPAHPWGAFRGVGGIKVTDTHQLILRAAYDLFTSDPGTQPGYGVYGIPIAGGRVALFENIVQYEGVDAAIRTLTPYGPGPDAEGSTLYSCHWFNPATGRGLAPQSAADWYQHFIQAGSGLSGSDEDAFKGLAWSAHFLADMFVPYHLVGMPADEALARINALNFFIGPNEAGPAFFIDPAPPRDQSSPGNVFDQGERAFADWKKRGWGPDSDFRETYKVFEANYRAAGAGKPQNHLDWFDPWYWNGPAVKTAVLTPHLSDPNTDQGRAVFSSHASYEALAHARFVKSGGFRQPFGQGPPYDPIWQNAPPDYAFAGTAWQAQAWQVQDFAARSAARTLQNAELCWRQPEIAIDAAVKAVYTMWRSAYSALLPVIQAGRDPARPNDGLVVQVQVQNSAYEACHDARVRMTIRKGGAIVKQWIEPIDGPVSRDGAGQAGWFVPISPNEEWTLVAEVVGVYDKTPDLQYKMSYAEYRPEPPDPMQQFLQQGRPVEEADSSDFVGRFIHTDPLRTFNEYHGEILIQADGTFTDVDYLTNGTDIRRGSGTWTFDPMTKTVSFDWQPGGEFSGPVSGNTSDFTINGRWSNGGSGTLRFQRQIR